MYYFSRYIIRLYYVWYMTSSCPNCTGGWIWVLDHRCIYIYDMWALTSTIVFYLVLIWCWGRWGVRLGLDTHTFFCWFDLCEYPSHILFFFFFFFCFCGFICVSLSLSHFFGFLLFPICLYVSSRVHTVCRGERVIRENYRHVCWRWAEVSGLSSSAVRRLILSKSECWHSHF